MALRRGTRVRFKAGKGTSIGKIVSVKDGKATIKTATGALVRRAVDGLSDPDAEEDSSIEPAPVAKGGAGLLGQPEGDEIPSDLLPFVESVTVTTELVPVAGREEDEDKESDVTDDEDE